MAKKRQTVDAAALIAQAEQRGRELGRQDLAVELCKHLPHGSRANLRDLRIWLHGYLSGHSAVAEPECWLVEAVLSVKDAEAVADAVIEEANKPAF